MRMFRWLLLFLIATLAAPAAEPPRPAPAEMTGLAVGQPAPNFTLRDQHGKERSLASLLQLGPVALVFHRSADW